MKIKIQGVPQFEIPFTPGHLAVMRKCAQRHYDATCRLFALGDPSKAQNDSSYGALRSWERTLELYSGSIPCSADSRQIDTLRKVLEHPMGLSPEQHELVDELQGILTKLWYEYTRAYGTWSIELDTDVKSC
jgi:hypothetical protein